MNHTLASPVLFYYRPLYGIYNSKSVFFHTFRVLKMTLFSVVSGSGTYLIPTTEVLLGLSYHQPLLPKDARNTAGQANGGVAYSMLSGPRLNTYKSSE